MGFLSIFLKCPFDSFLPFMTTFCFLPGESLKLACWGPWSQASGLELWLRVTNKVGRTG